VFRRAVDARKKSAIALIYTLDVAVRDEKALLRRLKGDRNVSVAPDMDYRFVTHAPAGATRPVIIGTALRPARRAVLAQMGFRPIILERGKVVRERTRTPGPVAQGGAQSGIERAVRRAVPAPSRTASSIARISSGPPA